MNKGFQLFFKTRFIIFVSIAFILSGCPLTVNLNISTDKPISLVIDKPIEMKVGADLAVTKLPPVKVGADLAVTKLPPVKVGVTNTKNNNK